MTIREVKKSHEYVTSIDNRWQNKPSNRIVLCIRRLTQRCLDLTNQPLIADSRDHLERRNYIFLNILVLRFSSPNDLRNLSLTAGSLSLGHPKWHFPDLRDKMAVKFLLNLPGLHEELCETTGGPLLAAHVGEKRETTTLMEKILDDLVLASLVLLTRKFDKFDKIITLNGKLLYLLDIHGIKYYQNEDGAELSWGETDGAANESDRHRKKLRSAKSAARKEEAEPRSRTVATWCSGRGEWVVEKKRSKARGNRTPGLLAL
ncbi:hypothetical protein EAG_14506 [Camponotus floridanus]|uniref:Uncharacterized protein n=1 Tax=Camponotus floridanus TaxID=104421 RepID=E2B1Z0_CAMFO|nr:hypothetical protein EAG_14506 [Camponotus floridanus]